MGRATNQGEIGVVLDGRYYGITTYAEERTMLSEQEIKQALRASRVAPISVSNPHGPFGLEQLACAVGDLRKTAVESKVIHSDIPVDTWNKLAELANAASKNSARPVSVSEVAAAILQHYVSDKS